MDILNFQNSVAIIIPLYFIFLFIIAHFPQIDKHNSNSMALFPIKHPELYQRQYIGSAVSNPIRTIKHYNAADWDSMKVFARFSRNIVFFSSPDPSQICSRIIGVIQANIENQISTSNKELKGLSKTSPTQHQHFTYWDSKTVAFKKCFSELISILQKLVVVNASKKVFKAFPSNQTDRFFFSCKQNGEKRVETWTHRY